MQTKICSGCKQEKSLDQFNFKNKGKAKRQQYCKICNRIKCRNYYHNNKQHHLSVIYKLRKKYFAKAKKLIAILKQKGCAICREDIACCLDFHHLYKRETANIGLSNVIRLHGIDVFIRELSKCCVVCSNCHRKIHNNLLNKAIIAALRTVGEYKQLRHMYDQMEID